VGTALGFTEINADPSIEIITVLEVRVSSLTNDDGS
jgi:hypothetical protein